MRREKERPWRERKREKERQRETERQRDRETERDREKIGTRREGGREGVGAKMPLPAQTPPPCKFTLLHYATRLGAGRLSADWQQQPALPEPGPAEARRRVLP